MIKNIDFPMLLLATLVIVMFFSVGIAIAFRSLLFIILFIVLGFSFMGFGLKIKKGRM